MAWEDSGAVRMGRIIAGIPEGRKTLAERHLDVLITDTGRASPWGAAGNRARAGVRDM